MFAALYFSVTLNACLSYTKRNVHDTDFWCCTRTRNEPWKRSTRTALDARLLSEFETWCNFSESTV